MFSRSYSTASRIVSPGREGEPPPHISTMDGWLLSRSIWYSSSCSTSVLNSSVCGYPASSNMKSCQTISPSRSQLSWNTSLSYALEQCTRTALKPTWTALCRALMHLVGLIVEASRSRPVHMTPLTKTGLSLMNSLKDRPPSSGSFSRRTVLNAIMRLSLCDANDMSIG